MFSAKGESSAHATMPFMITKTNISLCVFASLCALLLVAGAALVGCSAPATQAPSNNVASLEALMSTQGVGVISPEQTKQILEQYPDALLIDVREPSEYAQGHIPGSFLVPLGAITSAQTADVLGTVGLDAAAQAKGLGGAKDASAFIVYCRSGVRSAQAAQHMANVGLSPVLDAGGINKWPYDIEK
ncbi:MAG: rhodanese-like domain-containing protein [Raoultibacter sp.]